MDDDYIELEHEEDLEEDGSTTVNFTEVRFSDDRVAIVSTFSVHEGGKEVDRDVERVVITTSSLDRLIELYQQYRKEHEA